MVMATAGMTPWQWLQNNCDAIETMQLARCDKRQQQ